VDRGSFEHYFEEGRQDLVKEENDMQKACEAHHVNYKQPGLLEGQSVREGNGIGEVEEGPER
jgi:hypothetical protein